MTPARWPAGRYSVPRFLMTYRYRDGNFAGAVVVESNALINARMRVALSGVDKGLTFLLGDMLDDDSAAQVPVELLGRLLDQSALPGDRPHHPISKR